MDIVNRAGWGALSPRKPMQYVAATRRRIFVVHHSGAPVDQAVKDIQHWCMFGRGFNDIDYNFLVRGDTGQIYEGRGWDAIGSHTANFNTVAAGVCVIGDNEISDAAKSSVRWLYDKYCERAGRKLSIKGHRQLATTGTTCPGDNIYAWVRLGMPVSVAPMRPVEGVSVSEENMSPEDMDKLATIVADKVWARRFGSAATDKRWPGAGEKSMSDFVVLGSMSAKDAVKAVSDAVKVVSATPVSGTDNAPTTEGMGTP